MPDITLTREELIAIIKEANAPSVKSVLKEKIESIEPPAPITPNNPTPVVSVPWYASKTFAAVVQTSILTALGWLTVVLSTGKYDDWPTALALPIVSNLLILFRDMWSTTIVAPIKFLNVNNAPAKIGQVSVEK